ADSVSVALEAQAATMANTNNTNRNTGQRETPIARKFVCPTMMPNSKKLMEVFIEGLPKSIEGNVTASKPQTLEEAITITNRLRDQESILTEGQECSPRFKCSHGYVPSKPTSR
nr:reverse transcriptase domain-containing protein [Tanacetum cinerariifolium]